MGLLGGWGGGCCSTSPAHVDARQPWDTPPLLGDPGTWFDDPHPLQGGEHWQKREKGTQPPAVSLPLCPASAPQGHAGLGWVGAERAEQGLGGERRGVGTRPPVGRPEGGLLTFARAWARQFAPRSQMTKYTTRRKRVTRGGAATRRVLLNRRPASWPKTLGLGQARGREQGRRSGRLRGEAGAGEGGSLRRP